MPSPVTLPSVLPARVALGEPDPRRWYTLIALVLSAFLAAMSISIINVALPEIGRTFSTSFSDLQWVSTAYTLVAASLTILAVKLGDIFGRKRLFLVGVAGFTLGSLLCALAQSVTLVIAGRALMGLGGAIILPVALAIITVTFIGEELSTAVGIFSLSTISLVIGPILGGSLVQAFNWRSVFWLNVVLGVGVLLACLMLLNESRKEGADRRIDVPGALFSIAMSFFLVLGLIKGQEWGWMGGKTLGSFAAAIGALILFVLTEARLMARGREPLMNLTPFRSATFNVAIFATIVVNAGFAGFLFLLALLLQGPLGYDALGSGLRYVPLMVGFLFVSPMVSRFEPRLNPRLLYRAGFGLFVVGTLLLTRLSARDDWNVLIPGLLIAGVGCAIAQIETILGAVVAVPLSLTTMASGTSAAFRQVGSSMAWRSSARASPAATPARSPARSRLPRCRHRCAVVSRMGTGWPSTRRGGCCPACAGRTGGAGRHPSGVRNRLPRRGGGGLVDPGGNDDSVGVDGQTHRPCGDHGSSARAHGSAGAATSVGTEARKCSVQLISCWPLMARAMPSTRPASCGAWWHLAWSSGSRCWQ